MYIPKLFAETDEEALLAFMREFNFATLVTAENDFPTATHLPFIIEKRGDKIVLSAHLAKANLHWKQFEKDILVIFQEPHAYISPSHYTEKLNVPTWNYVAVHAYGKAKIFESVEENLALLEKMIVEFDKNYFENQWREIPDEYKISNAKGIIAFEIEVTNLQGKKKLNQNKGLQDAENVIAAFDKSGNQNERQIARFMKEVYQK
ncbi:MAG TPA: FMN-binding negative transcriptional regulator [Pyrinomonadaceae bacterium]|nr:FMN-binding negative transcriptional regulator [Pyrinomonadaceae bacterium]